MTKKLLLLLLVFTLFYGCSDTPTQENTNNTQQDGNKPDGNKPDGNKPGKKDVSYMDITDAKSLYIATDSSNNVDNITKYKSGAAQQKLYKLKTDGSKKEVTYRDGDNNAIKQNLEPKQIVILNEEYVIVAFGEFNYLTSTYDKSYLTNINTGAMYIFNKPLPACDGGTICENVQKGKGGTIYYKPNFLATINKLNLSDPKNITIKRVSFELDNVENWAVDTKGNVIYDTGNKYRFILPSGINKKTYIFNDNGTKNYEYIQSSTTTSSAIQGADGNIYIESDDGYKPAQIYRLPLIDDNKTTQNEKYEVEAELIPNNCTSARYSYHLINSQKYIRTPDYYTTHALTGTGLVKIPKQGAIECVSLYDYFDEKNGWMDFGHSNTHFYFFGKDKTNPSQNILLTVSADLTVTKKSYDFNKDERYEIKNMTMDSNGQEIYFNGIDSIYGNEVFGKILIETGEVTILAKPSKDETITLTQIR